LSRDTSRLLREVREEGRIIVCRHGDPVALIVSLEDGLDWALSRMEGEMADRIHQDLLKGRYEQVRRARRELAFELLGERRAQVAAGRLLKDGERFRW
jgi:prevent-host-death family protein